MPSTRLSGSPSISIRSEKVPESPSSALQVTYFCAGRLIEHGLPLDAGRKRRPAAAAQARAGDRLHDGLGAHRERASQPLIAAVDDIICHACRVDDADTRKRQALLAGEPRNRISQSRATERVCAALQEVRVEEARHIARAHGPVGDPSARRRHLHQRLQPIRAARAVADELQLQSARRRFASNRVRNLPRAERESAGITGHIHRKTHAVAVTSWGRRPRAARRSAPDVTRPCSWPSIMTAGEHAQLPRQ